MRRSTPFLLLILLLCAAPGQAKDFVLDKKPFDLPIPGEGESVLLLFGSPVIQGTTRVVRQDGSSETVLKKPSFKVWLSLDGRPLGWLFGSSRLTATVASGEHELAMRTMDGRETVQRFSVDGRWSPWQVTEADGLPDDLLRKGVNRHAGWCQLQPMDPWLAEYLCGADGLKEFDCWGIATKEKVLKKGGPKLKHSIEAPALDAADAPPSVVVSAMGKWNGRGMRGLPLRLGLVDGRLLAVEADERLDGALGALDRLLRAERLLDLPPERIHSLGLDPEHADRLILGAVDDEGEERVLTFSFLARGGEPTVVEAAPADTGSAADAGTEQASGATGGSGKRSGGLGGFLKSVGRARADAGRQVGFGADAVSGPYLSSHAWEPYAAWGAFCGALYEHRERVDMAAAIYKQATGLKAEFAGPGARPQRVDDGFKPTWPR